MEVTSDARSALQVGYDRLLWGLEATAKSLAPDLSPESYLILDGNNGLWRAMTEVPVRWRWAGHSGFLAGQFWLAWATSKRPEFREYAEKITSLHARPKPWLTIHEAFSAWAGPALGYELTKTPWMKERALETCTRMHKYFAPTPGIVARWPPGTRSIAVEQMEQAYGLKLWEVEGGIDDAAGALVLFWSEKLGATDHATPIRAHLATWERLGLVEDSGRVRHALGYDLASGKFEHHQYQGFDQSTEWVRAQAWGMLSWVVAYEATGEPGYLTHAKRICDYWTREIAGEGRDPVPFYDVRDPRARNVPRDTCAASVACTAMVRLGRRDPELAERYRPCVERTLTTLIDSHVTASGTLLHGCWGKLYGQTEEVIMPFGAYYLFEALAMLLHPELELWPIRG